MSADRYWGLYCAAPVRTPAIKSRWDGGSYRAYVVGWQIWFVFLKDYSLACHYIRKWRAYGKGKIDWMGEGRSSELRKILRI